MTVRYCQKYEFAGQKLFKVTGNKKFKIINSAFKGELVSNECWLKYFKQKAVFVHNVGTIMFEIDL